MMSAYVWRIPLGIVIGAFVTPIAALLVSGVVLLYRIPQAVMLLLKGDIYPLLALYFISKALAFLVPLWLTVLVVHSDEVMRGLGQFIQTDYMQLLIR